ncbi:cytochrome c-type biogenesis protein [Lacibacterium aquatile]|uniref:Cytochrome c-type biogenesis protein n=1 Tax=Lacibacterium aquatile TaxID=1168082 RepID=A0ABW5DWM5_9PROT
MKRLLILLALIATPALGVQPDEVLKDPLLETRARSLSKELRCLVCQNESIDDSNADLARALRLLVRERLVAGDTDSAVLAYVQDRYGDFVLLRPPVKGATAVLWFGPPLLLAGLLGGLYLASRRRRTEAPKPLSADEKARLDALDKDIS